MEEKNDIEAIASSHLLSAFEIKSLLEQKEAGRKVSKPCLVELFLMKGLFLLQAEMTQKCESMELSKVIAHIQ